MKNIVKTEEGLLFKEITVPEYKLPCDLCSYHGSCDNIRDPQGRDDITFLDYCGEMSDSMIPVECRYPEDVSRERSGSKGIESYRLDMSWCL